MAPSPGISGKYREESTERPCVTHSPSEGPQPPHSCPPTAGNPQVGSSQAEQFWPPPRVFGHVWNGEGQARPKKEILRRSSLSGLGSARHLTALETLWVVTSGRGVAAGWRYQMEARVRAQHPAGSPTALRTMIQPRMSAPRSLKTPGLAQYI